LKPTHVEPQSTTPPSTSSPTPLYQPLVPVLRHAHIHHPCRLQFSPSRGFWDNFSILAARKFLLNPLYMSIVTFDYWRPHKLEERGTQQVSTARNLFESHRAQLSPSNRDLAESLLD
jgi:hypothetical protein